MALEASCFEFFSRNLHFHQPSRHLYQGSKAAHASPAFHSSLNAFQGVWPYWADPMSQSQLQTKYPMPVPAATLPSAIAIPLTFYFTGCGGGGTSLSQIQPAAIHPCHPSPVAWHISTAMHTSPAASSAPLPTHHPSLVRCVWMGRMSLYNDAKKKKS